MMRLMSSTTTAGNKRLVGSGLLRGIDDTHPVWTVRAARYDNDRWERVDPQRIVTAWF
jgi:hypothetical protein